MPLVRSTARRMSGCSPICESRRRLQPVCLLQEAGKFRPVAKCVDGVYVIPRAVVDSRNLPDACRSNFTGVS